MGTISGSKICSPDGELQQFQEASVKGFNVWIFQERILIMSCSLTRLVLEGFLLSVLNGSGDN